jgi:uncharacterized protein
VTADCIVDSRRGVGRAQVGGGGVEGGGVVGGAVVPLAAVAGLPTVGVGEDVGLSPAAPEAAGIVGGVPPVGVGEEHAAAVRPRASAPNNANEPAGIHVGSRFMPERYHRPAFRRRLRGESRTDGYFRRAVVGQVAAMSALLSSPAALFDRSLPWFTLAAWLGLAAFATTRTRAFGAFAAVIVGIYSLIAVAYRPAFVSLIVFLDHRSPTLGWVAFALLTALHSVVYVNYARLARPAMRSLGYRLLVSWPSAFFAAGTLFALPWGIALALGYAPPLPFLPYAFALVGLAQSLTTHRHPVTLVADGPTGLSVPELRRHPLGGAAEATASSRGHLRIVQISDPHLGPFMSVARLREIAQRAVAEKPDLIFLTGDFLTMESQQDVAPLRDAFAPLAAYEGRVFACNGNHDHEAPAIVREALSAHRIPLLVDESVTVETDKGLVQIVGMDFVWRDRETHHRRVSAAHPRIAGAFRIVLLHDPGAFTHLPAGEADLVLSGHTHGGQVGLLSLGLPWTMIRVFASKLPDQGLWARGTDRLYVHRGTGHYGFPLRVGVPAEESVLEVRSTLLSNG